jgi:phosphoglycolate phosphatase
VRERFPDAGPAERRRLLEPALRAFDAVRDAELRLYPGVGETLTAIRATGCRVVGYTEATEANIKPRLRRLGLSRWLEHVYAPRFDGGPHPDGPRPDGDSGSARRSGPLPIRPLEPRSRKPNVDILRQIIEDLGVSTKRCLYVGDSVERDVAMAEAAGALSAWAAYGCAHDPALEDRLAAVSHRGVETPEPRGTTVAGPPAGPVAVRPDPDVTLVRFGDLPRLFDFGPPPERVRPDRVRR